MGKKKKTSDPRRIVNKKKRGRIPTKNLSTTEIRGHSGEWQPGSKNDQKKYEQRTGMA